MLRPRLVLLSAAVGVAGLAGAACAEQSAAIRIGDDTISEQDFLDEVQALSDNETALQLIVGAARADLVGELGEDSYTQPFIGYMVEQRVFLTLQGQLADQEGIEPSDADLDDMRSNIEGEFENAGGDLSDLPDSFVDQLVEDVAVSQALQSELAPEDFQAAFVELAGATDVELSSRFGSWDPDVFLAGLQGQQTGRGSVSPPAAPQPAPGDRAGTDPGLPAG